MFEEMTGKQAQVEYLPMHPADMLANWRWWTKPGSCWAGSRR
jgi:hypothetical protein